MARTEATRSSATKSLAESERAVSRVVRELARLEAERRDAEKKLALLEAEQRETGLRIDARRGELAEWLRRHYMHGGADSMAPLLSAQDPNQLARDAHYLEHLGRARLALIDGLRADLDQTRRRAEEIQSRRDRLAALEGEQRSRRSELQSEQARRKQALAAVSRQLQAQKKEVGTLQQDEQQLARVIDTLVKRAREAAAREAARRLAAQRAVSALARLAPQIQKELTAFKPRSSRAALTGCSCHSICTSFCRRRAARACSPSGIQTDRSCVVAASGEAHCKSLQPSARMNQVPASPYASGWPISSKYGDAMSNRARPSVSLSLSWRKSSRLIWLRAMARWAGCSRK